ncbi:hypothetical protein E2C01_079670 [Portunus trituberculatus]|uniref:Uncharacterized protein n=1 Tax=Portunus trituberculatus TaxID=210409 RepID=A0A5B7ITY2_PORTR|nr:hypothetical protein [Portunus trituberculatus]
MSPHCIPADPGTVCRMYYGWPLTHLIKVATHNMDVGSQGLEVVIALLGAQVASAQNVLDTSRHQQLLEFCRQ